MIKLKLAYEKPAKDDGERILVERLWPRGLTREQAKFDLWLKDIAPSMELRRRFGHFTRTICSEINASCRMAQRLLISCDDL
jgi:uncharacterized protein YeaO (DUF488 family)